MMRLRPQSDYLLCVMQESSNDIALGSGLVYQVDPENKPIAEYKVVDMTEVAKSKTSLQLGDTILINSIPTKTKVNDDVYYLVKAENVICKVCS